MSIPGYLGITPPREINGVPQDPIDGVSWPYTFEDATAEGRRTTVECRG